MHGVVYLYVNYMAETCEARDEPSQQAAACCWLPRRQHARQEHRAHVVHSQRTRRSLDAIAAWETSQKDSSFGASDACAAETARDCGATPRANDPERAFITGGALLS